MTIEGTEFVGTWRSDPSDSEGGSAYGDVTLKFSADVLLYIVHEKQGDQIIRLTYRTEPGVIITDQPSQPRVERTAYHFGEDGALILSFGGKTSRYLKAK
jgi:hypothetical protein